MQHLLITQQKEINKINWCSHLQRIWQNRLPMAALEYWGLRWVLKNTEDWKEMVGTGSVLVGLILINGEAEEKTDL